MEWRVRAYERAANDWIITGTSVRPVDRGLPNALCQLRRVDGFRQMPINDSRSRHSIYFFTSS